MSNYEPTQEELNFLRRAGFFCQAYHMNEQAQVVIRHAVKELIAKQAKIDELMLEYCPDEMANEQAASYEKHQVPVTPAQLISRGLRSELYPPFHSCRCVQCEPVETEYEHGSDIAPPSACGLG